MEEFDEYEHAVDAAEKPWQRRIDEWHLGAASFVSESCIDPWDVFDAGWVAAEITKRTKGVSLGVFAATRSLQILRIREDVSAPEGWEFNQADGEHRSLE